MKTAAHIAKHLREVYFGGNWTSSHLKEHLSDLSWEQANKQVHSLNTIATLAFHMNYYIGAALPVLKGGDLNASDELSFKHPAINSQHDWDKFLEKTWKEAEEFAALIEQLPEELLWQDFSNKKYGIYYRNLHGIIEHLHYHLGQIVLIKKILKQIIEK